MTLKLNYAYRYFLKLHTSVVDSQKKKKEKTYNNNKNLGKDSSSDQTL